MPRFSASSTMWKRSTLPPPDFGFMIRTGCWAGGTDVTCRGDLLHERCARGERVSGQDKGEDDEDDGGDQHEAVELAPDEG